jgi:tetratricopeptide (TPR) repeat protein
MNYINKYELIKAILKKEGEYLDHHQLISTVDRNRIIKKINKTNPELAKFDKFYITEEPVEEKNWSLLKRNEKKKIIRLAKKLKKSLNLDKVINKLIEYKSLYPNVPTIYNYLGIAYERTNQTKKYYDTLIETIEKFPDYLFGKISLSEYYLNTGSYKKISEVFDNKFEITQHFPMSTNVFHISAVRGFYYVTGRYFVNIGKIERAYKSYFLLSDLDPDHQTTEILGKEIMAYELNELKKSFNRQKK